jgi:outer membrane protein assembly factor BamB
VAYSTPCVYSPEGGRPQLIFNSEAHGISSINPSDGQTNWELSVFDKRSVSSPVIAAGLIFGSCGSGAGGNYVVALKPGGAGVAPEVAYKVSKSAPYVPTPIAKDDWVFLWSDQGVVTCCQASTGKQIWQERVGGKYFGSPVCVGGRLYCMSSDGDVAVVAAGPAYELLGKQSLGDPSHSTPAVSDGVMYLRTFTKLFALGGKKSS